MATAATYTLEDFVPFSGARPVEPRRQSGKFSVYQGHRVEASDQIAQRGGEVLVLTPKDRASDLQAPAAVRCLTEEQYGAAYRTGFQRTIRFLRSRGANADVAEEVAQAAWVRGWERLHQLRTPEALEVWVASIAKHMFSAHAVGSQRSEEIEETTAACGPTETGILWNEIVSSCRPEEKKLLDMHYVRGYSSGEIAAKLGCSALAVRLRLMRVRRKIDATLPASMLSHAA